MSGPYPPPPRGTADPWRIWRDPEHGWIAGVCAGIADHLGVPTGLVRAVAVVGLILFILPTVVGYVALAFVLPPRPPVLFANAAEEALWRDLRTDPRRCLASVGERLRALDRRVGHAEALLASDEFDLRRGFRDLGA